MPLCPYFVSGKCSYGSKCVNDHHNFCQIVQNEAKAAIYGKQWPLSCFAPFKDEQELPNFIQDQSFEEVRFDYFIAVQTNKIPQFIEQWKKDTAQAFEFQNKLFNCDQSVQSYLIDTYGVNRKKRTSNPQVSVNSSNSNPFAAPIVAVVADQQAGRSIFDRIIPGSSNPSVGFGQQINPNQSQQSIFGGGGDNSQFRQSAAATNSQSIFGGSTQVANSIGFGQTATNSSQNSFFKLPQLGNQPPASDPPTTSIFGGGAPAQPQQAATTNIFAQANAAFQQTPSVFGGNSAFQTNTNVFAQNPLQPPPTYPQADQPSNPFQQQANIFNQPQANQQPSQQGFGQSQPENIFQVAKPNDVFGNLGTVAVHASQNNVFGGTTTGQQQMPQQRNVFGQQQLSQNQSAGVEVMYSKMEALTAEALEAFNANEFILGSVPTAPPPRELCF